MITKVLLDMDGVIVDFLGGVYEAHKRQSPYNDPRNFGIWDTEKAWGIAEDEFWKPLQFKGFWYNLYPLEDAGKIILLAEGIAGTDSVNICTSPDAKNPDCQSEKADWLSAFYPHLSKNVIFEKNKEKHANGNTVLIDDRDQNIDKFREAGGHGILVPRVWNSGWMNAERVIESLRLDIYKLVLKESKYI